MNQGLLIMVAVKTMPYLTRPRCQLVFRFEIDSMEATYFEKDSMGATYFEIDSRIRPIQKDLNRVLRHIHNVFNNFGSI